MNIKEDGATINPHATVEDRDICWADGSKKSHNWIWTSIWEKKDQIICTRCEEIRTNRYGKPQVVIQPGKKGITNAKPDSTAINSTDKGSTQLGDASSECSPAPSSSRSTTDLS